MIIIIESGLVNVDLDGLHGTIGENSGSLSGLGRGIPVAKIITGDEDILILAGGLLNTDHVAVGIQVQIVLVVLQVAGIVEVQRILVKDDDLVVLVGGAVGGDAFALGEGVQHDLGDYLGVHNALDLALGDGNQNEIAVLIAGDGFKVLQLQGLDTAVLRVDGGIAVLDDS